VPGQQLRLSIPTEPPRALPARLVPMRPSTGVAPFDDPAYLFEPWWPGVRTLAFVEGGRMHLQAEGLTDADAAFDELADEVPQQLLTDGVVLDGTLLVLDRAGRLAPHLLRERMASAAHAGRPAFVASDLLWSDGRSWTRRPYVARRERLTSVLIEGDRCVVGRAYRTDGTLLAEALAALGIDAISARRLDARYRFVADEAWLRIPIRASEDVAVRPSLALIQRLPLADPS
jgi:bifunctional non-homologous end joining protein LigD